MANRRERILLEILERALESGADAVTLEHVPEGVEVLYIHGQAGVGHVVAERGLISHVASRAGLVRRDRGEFSLAVRERRRTVLVEEYQNFGETGLRLRFRKPRSRSAP